MSKLIILSNYTQQELCEIHSNLNNWEWDERVGNKPEGFDELPEFNRRLIHKIMRKKTKCDYIEPIVNYIGKLVPYKELLRHHNIHNLNRTNEQFEMWWQEMHISGRLI